MYGIVWQMNVEPQNFPTSPSRQILAQLSLFCSSSKDRGALFLGSSQQKSLTGSQSHCLRQSIWITSMEVGGSHLIAMEAEQLKDMLARVKTRRTKGIRSVKRANEIRGSTRLSNAMEPRASMGQGDQDDPIDPRCQRHKENHMV